METISVASKIEELRIKMVFSQGFSVDRIGRSGGLAVLWQNRAECSITGYTQNHVDLIFNENNMPKWRLSCFYGLPERSRRKQSWELISKLAMVASLPWCIMGDFNDLLYKVRQRRYSSAPGISYARFS